MEDSQHTKQMDATQAEASTSPIPDSTTGSSQANDESPVLKALGEYLVDVSGRMSEVETLMLNQVANKNVRQPYKKAWRKQINDHFLVAARIRRRIAS